LAKPEQEGASAPPTRTVHVGDAAVLRKLSGTSDANLRVVADELGIRVGARGEALLLTGDPDATRKAEHVFRELIGVAKKVDRLEPAEVVFALAAFSQDENADLKEIFLDEVVQARGGRRITPKGVGQKRYVDAIRSHDVTFGIGPAGTGKTYLAMALAVAAFKADRVSRIVLTRPAVEAGERLGFLPGDLEAKINPYLRPLYDALYDLMGFEESQVLIEKRVIEVAPLAFMRGRTLNDAFVILDEAQNTTREQMKMFLTRLGFGSKMVVSGDLTQTDLPRSDASGLAHAVRLLEDVGGVAVCRFTRKDVVRHGLVQRIIRAYEHASEDDR